MTSHCDIWTDIFKCYILTPKVQYFRNICTFIHFTCMTCDIFHEIPKCVGNKMRTILCKIDETFCELWYSFWKDPPPPQNNVGKVFVTKRQICHSVLLPNYPTLLRGEGGIHKFSKLTEKTAFLFKFLLCLMYFCTGLSRFFSCYWQVCSIINLVWH